MKIGLTGIIWLIGLVNNASRTELNQFHNAAIPLFTFENNLVRLSIPISDSDSLCFYLDTGGKNYLYKSGLKKLNIERSRKNLWEKSNIEGFFRDNRLPIPFKKEIYYHRERPSMFDGMLGREWFANRTWTFDYLEENLFFSENVSVDSQQGDNAVNLYFRTDSLGHHSTQLPRIQIMVDSDTLSVLLDTGAQAKLSPDAQSKLNKSEVVATSFINATTFEKWKKDHPDWPILEGADLSFRKKEDIIIVPTVVIGNKTIGPVEFTKREDSNFQVMSAFFMDHEITGAIGGNALSQLKRFTVSYELESFIIEN